MRVFLGPVEVAGYYKALERGLRSIGVDATAVDFSDHPFRYGSDSGQAPLLVRPVTWARRRLATGGRGAVLAKTVSRAARLPLFLWSLWRFDVFVFGSGDSFFRLHDLPLLKRLGKRVVMVFHGSDLRPPYMDGPTMGGWTGRSTADCANLAASKKQRTRKIERYADVIVSHPLYSHFLERPFIRFLAIGLPVLDMPVDISPRTGAVGRVRVLHSPSDAEVKGTSRIREAVAQLVAEGLPIDFVEVSNQPNAVVLRELQMADVVVDQLYSDTAMAGFATEAAGFGRPAIVGSCAWEEIIRVLPASETGPVRACDPDHVAEALREMVTDPDARRNLGDRARTFAAARSHPTQVARRLLQIISGDIPPEWYSRPCDIRHLRGGGILPERVQLVVRELVSRCGREALQLDDKPELQAALVSWAFSSTQARAPSAQVDRQPTGKNDAEVAKG